MATIYICKKYQKLNKMNKKIKIAIKNESI